MRPERAGKDNFSHIIDIKFIHKKPSPGVKSRFSHLYFSNIFIGYRDFVAITLTLVPDDI
jgi:hypothetical protein